MYQNQVSFIIILAICSNILSYLSKFIKISEIIPHFILGIILSLPSFGVIKNNKKRVLSSEGLGDTDWVIVDFGDIIVNVFKPETRKYYSIEKIWSDNELKDEKISFG